MTIYDEEGNAILTVEVDDNSYRYRAIMGDYNLTLYYSLAEHVEIPVGSYCEYQNETYTLERPEAFKMKHSRLFEYTVTFESGIAKAKIWKFRNPVDGRLKFSYTAYPVEHLQMFVDNMNARDSDGDWAVGECVDGVEVCISYNHAYCYDALGQMADELETEFEFVGKTVSLHKIEYNKDTPLALSYGRGNGFKPDIGRANYGDNPPIEILYTQGGTDNIDASTYGNSALLLPISQTIGYDGTYFEDEGGYDADNARTYVTDELGLSIRRSDKELTNQAEDSLDCSDVYPKRVGTVSSVIQDEDNDYFDIVDEDIPETLDYEDYLLDGETMTVIFQSGMLAGKEFDVAYDHDDRRFEISPTEIDGITMPSTSSGYYPKVGDTYAVFHCALPDAYICDDDTKSGASWDMFREGVRYLYENEDTQFTFTGELDGIWAAQDWENIGGKIKLGGYVSFTDERFQTEATLLRIIGIKDYINKPHSPQLELSNAIVTGNFSTQLTQLESTEVLIEDNLREAIQYTKRRFRDAKETISMLQESLLDNFTAAIQPITVETMSLLVGDESLQFRFVDSKTNPSVVSHTITWDNDAKKLTAEEGILQHMTLGISSISSEHDASEYMFWDIDAYESATLDDTTQAYYFYAKVSKSDETGEFLLSASAIAIEAEDGYYHLLVGILNSEYDEDRSFITLYGYTEILPGRITTDKIVSSDGNSYLDLVNNALKLGDAFQYNTAGDQELYINGSISQTRKENETIYVTYADYWSSSIPTYSENATVMYKYTTEGVYHYCSFYRSLQALSAYESTIDPPGSNSEQWAPIAEGVGVASDKYFANCLKNTDTTSPSTLAYTVTGTSGGTSLGGPNGGYMRYYTSVTDFVVKMTPKYYFNCGTIQDWGCSFAIKYSSFENIESIRFGFLRGSTFINPSVAVMFWDGYGLAIADVGDAAISNADLLTALEDTAADYSADTWHRIGWVCDTANYTGSHGHPVAYINIVCSSGTTIYFAEPLIGLLAPTMSYVYNNFYGTGGNGPISDYRFCQKWTGRDFDDIFEEGIDTELASEPVFQGDYDSSETYVGNDEQRDMVLASDMRYYLTTSSAGSGVSGIEPPNDTYWEPAGASYSIMGCKWMLGEKGVVGCAKFYNGKVIIEGNVTITGNLTVEGAITGNGITDESE